MAELTGKVAFVTGAARGQGRSHALRLAELGADIIAVDICHDLPTVRYPLATPEDLAETVRGVEALDRRIVARQADVRDLDALTKVVAEGVETLGGLDIVVTNAGVAPFGVTDDPSAQFRDAIDVNLVGTWHTLEASVPHLQARGSGSVVVISSSAGTNGKTSGLDAGARGYVASKHAVIGLMRTYALQLGLQGIRVNAITPCGVDTPMINSDPGNGLHEKAAALPWDLSNVIPVPYISVGDISDAVVWLTSDASKYVTGVVLPVDAGYALK